MIRVLVIDDSDVVRDALSSHLCVSQDIEVVGTAVDAFTAQDKVLRLQPDVAVLDLEMPGTDGLVLLTKIMTHHPVPVVVVSSPGPEGARAAICALHLGAVGVVNRPGPGVSAAETIEELVNKVHAAAAATAELTVATHAPAVRSDENGVSERIISQYVDDPDLSDIIDQFVDKLLEYAQTMRRLLQHGDHDELQSLAHQIKGTGGSYGYPKLSEMAADLERAAKARDTERAHLVLVTFSSMCQAIVRGRDAVCSQATEDDQ